MVLETPVVLVESARDPATGAVCGGEGALILRLARKASLSLTSEGAVLAGVVDGRAEAPVANVSLEAGSHTIGFISPVLSSPAGVRTFDLEARGAASSEPPSRVSGLVQGVVVNRSVMTVGHMFLHGVDLVDGHLTRQSTDLKVEGRHLSLEVTRTYSSAAGGASGWTGAGWALNFGERLTAFEACGLFVVTMADGSSQAFRSTDGRTFTPQRGYHASLRRLGDGSFDFFDKAGTRHHFSPPLRGTAHAHRLEYFEEAHGDRVELRYDRSGRLAEVSEVQPEAPGVRVLARTLRFSWTMVGGLDRLSSMEALGLGVRADYTYDARGNLIRATRSDSDAAGHEVESYAYGPPKGTGPSLLVTWTDTTGAKTEYGYAGPGATLGYLTSIAELPPKGGRVVTSIAYDHARAAAGVFLVTTREGSSAPQIYEMKANGDLARLEEADKQGRRVVKMEWAADHALKVRESDNLGYEAAWEYDRRGNETRSRIRAKAGAPEVEETFEYDPTFNKLVRKKDGQGKTSAWTNDPKTGDLLAALASDGKITRYLYDRRGNLVETRQPDGSHIVYAEHDNFGHATRITRPSGKVETPEFDPRGRRYSEDPPPKPTQAPVVPKK